MIKVLTTGRLATQFHEYFKDNDLGIEVRSTETPTQAQINWANCLASFPVDDTVSLAHLPWIHSFGAGVDGFLSRNDLHTDLLLSRTTGKLGAKAGEFCLCHLLNFLQDTFSIYEDMQSQTWRTRSAPSIKNTTVMILGTGRMAQGVATLLRSLGVTILGVNTSGITSDTHFARCYRFDDLPTLIPEVSCIINTLPHHEATQGLLDAPFFARFAHALLINIGRGQTVNTQALKRALDAGHIRYCVLDVFEQEPLPKASWLWCHPRVFISPHQAAITDIDDVVTSFIAALSAYGAGEHSNFFVNLRKHY